MPRRQTSAVKSEVLSMPTALVASAQNFSLPNTEQRNARLEKQNWHKLAWQWFDTIGEFRYSCNWVGNLLSKAILTVTYDGKVVTEGPAADALNELFGGPSGQAEMFRQLGLHMTVAGDAFIIADLGNTTQMDEWFVAAASEVNQPGGNTWQIAGETFKDPLVLRIWRPHPAKRIFSDAPTRAVLPILAEIDGLTKHVAAQIDSRLASAGILIVSDDVTFPTQSLTSTDTDGNLTTTNDGNDVDSFMRMLIKTASEAIANRESAGALVPIVIKVPAEAVDKIQHLTFWSGLDDNAIEMRTEAIRRLALGMDMPPEVLTGTADMNHWSSWQVEEAAIKMHTEPLLQTIVQSLTTGYLRPALLGQTGDLDLSKFAFGVDTSKLRLRPNRSKEAIELYNLGALSKATMVRENGFDVEDVMGSDEFKLWLMQKVAGGQTTPDLVDAALQSLGVDLKVIAGMAGDTTTRNPTITEQLGPDGKPVPPKSGDEETSTQDPTKTQQARPTPTVRNHPTRNPPAQPSGLAASAEQVVLRALERAGNRIKSKRKRAVPGSTSFDLYRQVEETYDLDYLLEDAFTQCDRIAGRYGLEADVLEHSLDQFTRRLLRDKVDFTLEELEGHLAELYPRAA